MKGVERHETLEVAAAPAAVVTSEESRQDTTKSKGYFDSGIDDRRDDCLKSSR